MVEVDPVAGYDDARSAKHVSRCWNRLRTVPGGERSPSHPGLPWTGSPMTATSARHPRCGVESSDATFTVIGPAYARVLGLPMAAGCSRLSGAIGIIDDALAERVWPGEDALGRLHSTHRQRGVRAAPPVRVVGHSGDEHLARESAIATVYRATRAHMRAPCRCSCGWDPGRPHHGGCRPRCARLDERLPIVSVGASGRTMSMERGSVASPCRRRRCFVAAAPSRCLWAVLGVYGVKSCRLETLDCANSVPDRHWRRSPRAAAGQVLERGRVTTMGEMYFSRPAVGSRRRFPGNALRREHMAG